MGRHWGVPSELSLSLTPGLKPESSSSEGKAPQSEHVPPPPATVQLRRPQRGQSGALAWPAKDIEAKQVLPALVVPGLFSLTGRGRGRLAARVMV